MLKIYLCPICFHSIYSLGCFYLFLFKTICELHLLDEEGCILYVNGDGEMGKTSCALQKFESLGFVISTEYTQHHVKVKPLGVNTWIENDEYDFLICLEKNEHVKES